MRHLQRYGIATWAWLFNRRQWNIQNPLDLVYPIQGLSDLCKGGRVGGQDAIQHSVPVTQMRVFSQSQTLGQRLSQSAQIIEHRKP
jgi:hypothetical protein